MPSRSFSYNGLVDDGSDPLTVHEAVHDVNRARNPAEPAISLLAQGVLTAKVDWNDARMPSRSRR